MPGGGEIAGLITRNRITSASRETTGTASASPAAMNQKLPSARARPIFAFPAEAGQLTVRSFLERFLIHQQAKRPLDPPLPRPLIVSPDDPFPQQKP